MPRYKKRFKWPKLELPSALKRDVFILLIFAVAIFSALSIFGLTSKAGEVVDSLWQKVFGWAWWTWPIILFIIGYLMINKERLEVKAFRWLGLFLLVISYSGILHLLIKNQTGLEAAQEGVGGGFIGYFISYPLISLAGFWGAVIILVALLFISLILFFEKSINEVLELFHLPRFTFLKNLRQKISWREKINEEKEEEILDVGFEQKEIESFGSSEKGTKEKGETKEEGQQQMFKAAKKNIPLIKVPVDLLNGRVGEPTAGDIKAKQQIIKKTLEHFGIEVEMADISVGPTVTQFTFKPASGVKVAQITTLANYLALALAAHPIRIEAPIPGKALVGIEVPNQKIALVSLKEILESKEFKNQNIGLNIALGKDVSGSPWLADLSRMPHLLIAGATGSGKTVCLNSIIISLLFQKQPDELKFIMVDPKRVELPTYTGIPHLITPVITDVKKTINALRWTVKEMDRRFQVLSNASKRNITVYNMANPSEKMPYLVLVIDELADLMATAAAEVEAAIIRLAQMARAVGIHLVLATQRPSVDVITGLIKANITSRIAFSVASIIDSRTILDTSGAEKLLGRGDMLFTTPELSKPKRIQGAFVSDDEINRVVDFLKEKGEPEYDETVTEKVTLAGGVSIPGMEADFGEGDELLPEAKEVIIQAGKASASYLQRRLRIGYARAARLLDLLEEQGIVGPADGAKAREVLVGREELGGDGFEDDEEEEKNFDEEE